MEFVSLKEFPIEAKIALLKEMGYDSDGKFILKTSGEKVIDPYLKEPVSIENMSILPGSEVIIDDNPLSIASYFEEHGELS